MKDDLGDRMKSYENEFKFQVSGKSPVYMRLDGRSFSKFTKKLKRNGLLVSPRDSTFESVFIEATKDTVQQFNLSLGFHQSDEISLFFPVIENDMSQLPFNGKIQKLLSVVTSFFTARFINHFFVEYGFIPEISFDARLCDLPSKGEAANMLTWRYQDARRNLIQDIAHHSFGHKALDKVSTKEKYAMIGSPNLFPGNFLKRVTFESGIVMRREVRIIPVNFDIMTFDEKIELIYEKE